MVSVFVVLLLTVPTSNVGAPRPPGTSLASSPGNQTAPPFYPFLSSPTTYPSPDELPNVTGTLSLPQISNLTIGNSFVYVLVFVDDVPPTGNVLEFDTGYYSPSAAQAIAIHGCTNNCTQHLPIQWDPPTPIAAYGGSPIQSDALQVEGSGPGALILVAASSNDSTTVYVSPSAGAAGSWGVLNGQNPILGGGVRLTGAPQACAITVATHLPGATIVTTFQQCFPPPLQGLATVSPSPATSGSGGGRAWPSSFSGPDVVGGDPAIYGVVPSEAQTGQYVTVYGSGFNSVRSVRFGSVATVFGVRSSTELVALMPPGAGSTEVQVLATNTWSGANCSGQVSWGGPLHKGTPQVFWVSNNATTAGATVGIDGFNFTSTDTVSFGSTAASVTFVNPSLLQAVVPTGSGTVAVTVTNGTHASPPTCADLFHYAKTYLYSITPASGEPPLTVTLVGTNFSSTAQVYFGTEASPSVTHLSSTELEAAVPTRNQTYYSVGVTVHQAGYKSDPVTFKYHPTTLVVSTVVPNRGPVGTEVAVYGSEFNASALVHFGLTNSTRVQYVSPGELLAVAPKVWKTVNVTVHQSGAVSPDACGDLFSAGTAYPTGSPEIVSVSSPEGVSGANITVQGLNFSANDTVLFSGVPSPRIDPSLSNSTVLNVGVPLGAGNVTITVTGPAGSSPAACSDRFDIVAPGSMVNGMGFSPFEVSLPASTDAVPVTLAQPVSPGLSPGIYGPFGRGLYGTYVVATIAGKLAVFSIYEDYVWSESNVTAIGTSLGSSAFTQVGETALTMPGGGAGELAVAPDGNGVFVLVTADQLGRTVLETLVSPEVGLNLSSYDPLFNWSQPYFVTPVGGSASDPQLAYAPFGEFYATWLENGGGPEQLDEAVFAPSGVVMQLPTVIPGSGGVTAAGNSALTPTLMVDPTGRPMVAWSWGAGPSAGGIAYTGAYELPALQLALLETAWSNMTPADFEAFGGPGLTSFEATVEKEMTSVATDLSSSDLCGAQQNASNAVYTNVTWIDPSPIEWGPGLPSCRVFVGAYHNTIVAPESGLLQANFFLSVETAWVMESLGVGVMPLPDWSAPLYQPQLGANHPYWPDAGGKSQDARGDLVQIVPSTVTDNALWLNAIGSFRQNSSTQTLTTSKGVPCGSIVERDSPQVYQIAATANDSTHSRSGTFNSTAGVPSPYFTHIYPDDNGTWKATVTVTFQTVKVVTNRGCGLGSPANSTTVVPSPPAGWPTVETFSLAGNFTTGLDPHPYELQLLSTPAGANETSDTMSWENTVDSTAQLWVNGTCGSACDVFWQNTSYLQYDLAAGGPPNPWGHSLANVPSPLTSLWFQIQSSNATLPGSMGPQVSLGEVSVPSPQQTVTIGCTMGSQPTAQIWDAAGTNVTNLTSNAGTFTWFSSLSAQNTSGWVSLTPADGVAFNVSAQVLSLKNGSSEYVAEATGLQSWGTYGVRYYVNVVTACRTSSGTTVAQLNTYSSIPAGEIQVTGQPTMFEQDAPYDSVTHQGGGATVAWQVPLAFETQPSTRFVNGSLTLTPIGNASLSPFVLPISAPLTPFTNYSQFGTNVQNSTATTFAVNVSGLSVDNEYTATLVLNYSTAVTAHFEATNSLTFWYEKDTSGDGLTDWEKSYGWMVTTAVASGATTTTHVTANVGDFATNGLVEDFVEKEYGLNPRTVDSAGSHLLDTWNLTFNLKPGSGNAPAGSNFQYWNEAGSYDPFASTVQYSPGLFEQGAPVGHNLTNLTPTASAGIRSGDGSPWAAEVLWSYSALKTFVTLPGVENAGWLRAVKGTWDGLPTLTVWGKLSWGANPLAASTPNNGVVDGSRINPLQAEGLSVTVSNLYVTGLSTGQGYAALFRLYDGSTATGTPVLTNYSAPVGLSGGIARLTGYTVVLPVSQTSQYQTLQLEIPVNESGTSQLTPVAFDNGATVVNVTYDMAAGQTVSENFGSVGSNPNGSLSLTLQAMPVGGKTPTYLWLPTNNGTVNGLPIGLERYTGEQSFDLVVVNVSTSVTSDPIPLPWGGTTAGLALSPGLNNLLLPREQFLASPLGQAVLLGHETAYANSSGTPLLLTDPGVASLLTGFGGANLSVDLSAYWQNRSIAVGPGTIPGTTEAGTPSSNAFQVNVLVVESTLANNTGGLPSNPSLYNTIGAPPAVQAVVTLNVTSTATLDLLLAGLVDNTTGGVNGTFQSVTNQVGFLGFAPSVVHVLANSVIPSQGLYGPPPNNVPPPPPSSGGLWGAFWNAVSAVVTTVAGAVVSLIEVTWDVTTAAFTYLNHLATEAAAVGGAILARAATALVDAGKILVQALEAFVSWILKEISQFVSEVTRPLATAFLNGVRDWASGLYSATNWTIAAYRSVSGAEAMAVGQLGAVLTLPVGIATAVGIAVSVVLGIAAPFDLGAGLLVGLLAPLVINLFGATLSSTSGPSWESLLFSQLDSGAKTTIAAFDSVTEWLFNQTHSFNSSAAGAFLAPGVPGDFWSLVTVVTGLGGLLSGLIATILAIEKAGSAADSTTSAASALIFSLIALTFSIAEYSVSLVAPSGGALGQIALGGELALAVNAGLFGILAIASGLLSLRGGAINPVTALAGGLATAFGFGSLWAGYDDVSAIYAKG